MKKKWWVCLTVLWIMIIYFMTEHQYFTGESTSTAIRKTIETTENIQRKMTKPETELPIVMQPERQELVKHLNMFFRKSAHILVFGILGLFIYQCFQPRQYSYVWALGLTFLYACFDEWHQSLVPDRTPAFKDVLFDTLGASIALFIFYKMTKKHHQS
ncbi:VanZ family protein [Pseudoneobacillus sp. C159]